MIKRTESKSKCSRRDRSERQKKKKRRLKMEGLEQRRLLAVLHEPPTSPALELPEFTEPRNIGAVQAFQAFETELINESGENDLMSNADLIPLGTGPGQQDTIDLTGSLPITLSTSNSSGFSSDIDTFAADLRGGDILDVATIGAGGAITVRDSNGSMIVASDIFVGGGNEPLQSIGNANAVVVIPEDGRYFITIAAAPLDSTANYTAGLRVYRPTAESLAIGDTQILYLDFAGAVIDNNIFNDALIQANPGLPVGGVTRVRSLADSLPILGLQLGDTATVNRIIDDVVNQVSRIYEELAVKGSNGDIESPNAQPGDYGIRILNSRDHLGAVSFDDPRVSRLLVGGTGMDFGVAGVFGIAQSVDFGNFDLNEFGIFALDAFAAVAPTIPTSPARSQVDVISTFLASVAAHEAGHIFGMNHTDNMNDIGTLSDAGGTQNVNDYAVGLGPDGIFGTRDDILPGFNDDFRQPGEPFDVNGFSLHLVTKELSHALSSGTVGATISGQAFSDANRDGISAGDGGLAGVTVFADVNGNGQQDASEPVDVTDANGDFSLNVAGGTFNVIAITPGGFAPTTPTSVSATSGVSSNVQFGFNQVVADITGTVCIDHDEDGFRDDTDSPFEGVYIYLDIDGDNRPDLGEPGTNSAADGTYSLNFPFEGEFQIRAVVPTGFSQSVPAGPEFEHRVEFRNGVVRRLPSGIADNFDFCFISTQDFGDAPDSYRTVLASDGPRHGIVDGLRLGAAVDAGTDGSPEALAGLLTGGDDFDDDFNETGINDEDGVILTTPLGPGAPATFAVTATNTTPLPAFLQAFIDLDRDGTFFGPGEQFVTNLLVPAGTVGGTFPVTVTLPASTGPGNVFTRFRLSNTSDLGVTGFAGTGEVEDHVFQVLTGSDIANDDEFTVSRNSVANELDVLGNDFNTVANPLTISVVDVTGTTGIVRAEQDRIFYTPQNGFIGRDTFRYTVSDQFGATSSATVVINVSFLSDSPIALDDTFEVPEGSVNRALNVLDNDIASIFGGNSITSVTAGTAGGTLTTISGGQSLRYTPLPGFNGTEQFTYSIQDAAGQTSSAQVTINLLPGSRFDDVVDFTVAVFDAVNTNTPVTNVQVGDDVLVRVSVDDLRQFANPEGVASAFIDLLYTDELIATLNTDNNPDFPFDITFGPLFTGLNVLQRGNSSTPGLIDEVGGVQRIDGQVPHSGPAELFTLRMRAVSPGVAVFQADPADMAVSETVVLGSDTELTPSQLRLGRTELLILPDSDNFTSAIDDSFPDGRDSNGLLISASSGTRHRLNVLENDNLGPTGRIREFGITSTSTRGNVFIDNNGTPSDLNDDFLSYQPNANENGLERIEYVIITDDNIRSTAAVTFPLGNAQSTSEVALDFNLVDAAGNSISSVSPGQRFGVQVIADDLRINPTFVFSAFADIGYTADIIQPSNTIGGDSFDYDVVFGPGYVQDPAVGVQSTAIRSGLIDEFGTLFATIPPSSAGLDPGLLGTIFFEAVGTGTARVVGGPADSAPFTDTLVFQDDNPIDTSRIRYDVLEITVGGGAAPLQNSTLRQDVNADGVVTPIDALLVINRMSIVGEGEQAEGESLLYYHDVNGDRRVSALDALQVINYLNRESNVQSVGESEQARASDQALAVVAINHADDDDDDLIDTLADDIAGLWN